MRIESSKPVNVETDAWLENRCLVIESAGRSLAVAVGQVNQRTQAAASGDLGRRRRITDSLLHRAETACRTLRQAETEIQNTLFDCERELRSLWEREVSPVELLVDGERLIRHYRFLRRRARILDGLLAYLPVVARHADTCLECLRRIQHGDEEQGVLVVPDCGFALIALEQLREESAA